MSQQLFMERLKLKLMFETALRCPTNPYAASKAAAEMSVNGPHQYPKKVMPKLSCLLKAAKSFFTETARRLGGTCLLVM